MATEWWQLDSKALAKDGEAREAKRLAYRNVFFGTTEGMRVLIDMAIEAREHKGSADFILGRLDIVDYVRGWCGISADTELAGLEAMRKLL